MKQYKLDYDPVREDLEKPLFLEYLDKNIRFLILKSYYEDYLGKVDSKFFRNALLKALDEFDISKHYVITYIYKEQLLGFSIFKKEKGIGRIFYIYVDKKERRKGLGKYLLQETKNAFRKLAVSKISLAALPIYSKFYKENGFIFKETIETENTTLNILECNLG